MAEWAANRAKDFAANRNFLKRYKSKIDLRQIQSAHNEVFADIDCLQCGNCCKTAHPIFTQTDLKRAAQFLGKREAAFEQEFLQTDAENDRVPNRIPCPLLCADNTCQVYEARPKSCRGFPHTDTKEGWERAELLAKNTLTCPAAFHIVHRLRR